MTKTPKTYSRVRKVSSINGAGLTGCLYVEKNENRLIFVTLHKAQVQVDQGPQHKTRYTELTEEKVGKSFELIGTGGNFLNRTPMAHALRSRIDKWDLTKLESFCKAKSIRQISNPHTI